MLILAHPADKLFDKEIPMWQEKNMEQETTSEFNLERGTGAQ